MAMRIRQSKNKKPFMIEWPKKPESHCIPETDHVSPLIEELERQLQGN
jgi:hypothetical protein